MRKICERFGFRSPMAGRRFRPLRTASSVRSARVKFPKIGFLAPFPRAELVPADFRYGRVKSGAVSWRTGFGRACRSKGEGLGLGSGPDSRMGCSLEAEAWVPPDAPFQREGKCSGMRFSNSLFCMYSFRVRVPRPLYFECVFRS